MPELSATLAPVCGAVILRRTSGQADRQADGYRRAGGQMGRRVGRQMCRRIGTRLADGEKKETRRAADGQASRQTVCNRRAADRRVGGLPTGYPAVWQISRR